MKKKILITGTGRCGTSFLIQLMSHLGMETGYSDTVSFDDHPPYNKNGLNAGLETMPLKRTDVRIHKTPIIFSEGEWMFATYPETTEIEKILEDTNIEHVIIMMRELEGTSNSRIHVSMDLNGSLELEDLMNYNGKLMYNLIHKLVKSNANFTFLPFPEIIHSSDIIYKDLKWIMDDYGISKKEYLSVYNNLIDPTKVRFK